MSPVRSSLLAAMSIAVLAGCGGGGSDEDQLASLTKGFIADIKAGRWDDACDAMSSGAKKDVAQAGALLGQTKCPKVMAAAFALDDDDSLDKVDPNKIQLKNIKINGDRATAEVTPSTDDDPTNRYVKEDGDWKVDSDPDDEAAKSSTTSSESTEDEAAQDTAAQAAPALTVTERGFTRTDSGAIYGAVIHNPGPGDATEVEVQVNLLGGGGEVLGTDTHTLAGIPENADMGVGGTGDAGGERVRKLEITVTADHGAQAGEVQLPKVSNARVRQTDFGTEVRAQVTNTLDEELTSITNVFAVLRNGSGRIVGGMSGYPESHIQPGSRASVTLGGLELLRTAVAADVYADAATG